MPVPSAIDRPIFAGPDRFMQQAAEKWKNRLNPPAIPPLEFDIPPAPPARQFHNVRPLRIPVQQSQQHAVRIERPVLIEQPQPVHVEQPITVPERAVEPLPIPQSLQFEQPIAVPETPVEPLPVPPAALPEQISIAPQQVAQTLESQLASLVPVVNQALKLLKHPRILGGLFFFGLLGLGYFLNPETVRNIDINVDADPEKKRTYRIILDKDKYPTTIRLGLTPGKPVDIELHRPETKMPTVYNIVIEAPGYEKIKVSEEHIDLGERQVIRLVDKR